MPLRHAVPSAPQLPDSARRKNICADHPISYYLDKLVKTGSESIAATLRRRRILFAVFVARMEDTRLPKCLMFGQLVGGADCVGGQEKEWMGCFLDDLRAFGINADRPVDDCNPGRREMAQDGGKRGGTFHGEMDRCNESQRWTTAACSSMPEHDRKDQGEDRPEPAGSYWFVRHNSTSHKWREFYPPGGCRVVFL